MRISEGLLDNVVSVVDALGSVLRLDSESSTCDEIVPLGVSVIVLLSAKSVESVFVSELVEVIAGGKGHQ